MAVVMPDQVRMPDVKSLLSNGYRATDYSYTAMPDGAPAQLEVTYILAPEMPRTPIDETVESHLGNAKVVSVSVEREYGGKQTVRAVFYVNVAVSKAREAYPGCQREYGFSAPGDYQPLLDSMGYEIVLQATSNSYSGFDRLLVKSGRRYGFLAFGWGSCSGCDALQSCNSYEEIDELRRSLIDSVIWHDSAIEMAEFMIERDWESQPCWHDDREVTESFVAECVELLSGASK